MDSLGIRHQPSGLNTHFAGDGLPFAEYVRLMAEMLRQAHCKSDRGELEKIVSGNAPFELHPSPGFPAGRSKRYHRGVLLTHGLTDSPYFMRYLASFFQRNGFRVMAVLLPGHGTQPGDLLDTRWQEWAKAVRYGAECLAAEADELYLAGFSAGSALSLLHSAQDERVRGLFLFSPAFEITPRAALANLHRLHSWLLPQAAWVSVMPDRDLYKYESFCKNAAAQMYALTQALPQREVNIPVFAAASADDVHIRPEATLRFMQRVRHPHKQLVWYATQAPQGGAPYIEWVGSALPEQRILSSAHTAIVLPPEDAHYGAAGDYSHCLHYYPHDLHNYERCIAASGNTWQGEVTERNLAHGLMRRLMYNPHYAAMEASMQKFIAGLE